jgi:hypothetical protein
MTGKDGKVYRIEGPVGLPRETVMAEILKRAPQAGKPALAIPDAALAAPTAVAPAQMAPEEEGVEQPGFIEQLGSSVKGGLLGLANLPQQIATQAFAAPVNAAAQEREIFDAIDSGKYKPKFKSEEELKEARMTAAMVAGQAGAFGMGIPVAAGPDTKLAIDEAAFRYYNAKPRERAVMRGGVDKITEKIAPRFERALQRVEEAEEKISPLRAKTTQVSDIDSWASFKNYLGGVIGETAAQLPVVMASSAVAGPTGGFTAGTAISYGAETMNRIAFAREKYKDLPIEKQAEAIAKYLRDTGDVVAVSAAVQGSLDLFGPVGTVLSRKITSELGKEGTRNVLETAAKRSFIESVKQEGKAAAKRFPREAGEEALTGGAQEVTSILGERAIGEQTGPLLSAENLKRVFEASVAEGIGGGLVGTPTTFTTGVIGSRSETARAKRTLRQEAEEGRLKEFDAMRGQLAGAFEAAVVKYKSEGMSETDALRKAGSDVQNYVAEQRKTADAGDTTVPGGTESGIPSDSGAVGAGAAAGATGPAQAGGLGATGVPTGAAAIDEDTQQRPLAPITGKQIKATIPVIEEAFEASAIDFEDMGVTKLSPEQKKLAARIVLESPEVAPYDAIGSVIERGMRLRGEEIPSRVAAAPAPVAVAPTAPVAVAPTAPVVTPTLDQQATAPVKAIIEGVIGPTPGAAVPSVAETTARQAGIAPLPAPVVEAPPAPPPVIEAPPAPPPVVEAPPEPTYTPQEIAGNLQSFGAQEASNRGYEANTPAYGMFIEGVRSLNPDVGLIADELILEKEGPEVLAAYKEGLQWGQERIAEAQAPAAPVAEPVTAVTPAALAAPPPEVEAAAPEAPAQRTIIVVHGGSDFENIDPAKFGTGEPGGIRPLGKGLYGFVVDSNNSDEIAKAVASARHYSKKYGRGKKAIHAFQLDLTDTETSFNGPIIESLVGKPPSPEEKLVREAYRRAGALPRGPERLAAFDEAKNLAEQYPSPTPDVRFERIPIGLTEVGVTNTGRLKRIGKIGIEQSDAELVKTIQDALGVTEAVPEAVVEEETEVEAPLTYEEVLREAEGYRESGLLKPAVVTQLSTMVTSGKFTPEQLQDRLRNAVPAEKVAERGYAPTAIEEELDTEIDYDEHPLMQEHDAKYDDAIEEISSAETMKELRDLIKRLKKEGLIDADDVKDIDDSITDAGSDKEERFDAGTAALEEVLNNQRDNQREDVEERIQEELEAAPAPKQTFEDLGEPTANLTEEPRSTDITALVEMLPEPQRVYVRATLDKIMARYAKDSDVVRLLDALDTLRQNVEGRIDRQREQRTRDRVRGPERAMEVLYRAERNGTLSAQAAGLVRWLIQRNPRIADELALSLRLGGAQSPAGQYNPIARLATIFTSRANDGTAVHEVLHHAERLMPEGIRAGIRAAWRKRIDDLTALAEKTDNIDMRNVLGAIVRAYYGDVDAQQELRDSFDTGAIPYSVYQLSNPSEFWAVNATDLIGRRAARTGWVGAARTWLSDFTEAAKNFFGLPNDSAIIAGLKAVLAAESGTVSGSMLSERTTAFLDTVSVKRLKKKLATADKAAELNRSAGALFFATRGSKEKIRLLNSVWATLDTNRRRLALYMFNFNRDILRNVQEYSPPLARKLAELDNAFKLLTGTRNKMLERLGYEANRWRKFNAKFKEGGTTLSMLLNASTSVQADPRHASLQDMVANDPKMKELTKKGASKRSLDNRLDTLKYVYGLYEQLADPKMGSGEGQRLYNMAITNFEKSFEAEHRTIISGIRNSGLSAAVKKDTERRINDMYNKAKQQGPYSPLYRSGDFWVRIGKGKARTTLRLDNETAWNFALQNAVEEIRQGGDTRSAEDIMADSNTLTYGRDIDGLQADFFSNEPSDVLKKVFEEIDKGGSADAKAIKDMVFQMYISSLPKGTTLERMQHRQGIAGFSADVLRAYTDTQMTAINRLAQLQHARDIRTLIGEAYGMLEGNANKNLLSPYVDEMAARTAQAISPNATSGSFFANLATKVSFIYLMTSIKSQLLQFFQLPFVGLTFLSERYGAAQTLALATRYMTTFPRKFGTSKRDENGNIITEWGQPTIGDSAYVRKNKNKELGDALQFGWDDMMSRGLAGSTYSGDLFGRRSRPSEQFETPGARTSRMVYDFTTGGMHHIERMSREIMYMSAFELEFKKQRAKGVDAKTAQVIAADTASELTQETMFDYAETSKPRMLKTVPGRVAFQFFTFPVQMASLLIRSFMGMVGLMPTRAERTAAAQKFFGVLGMTWMFAGTVGMPGYSFMMGVAQAIIDEMRPDDEEPGEEDDFNPLFSRNLDLWFRELFLPKYFGPDSDLAFYLDLSPEQAKTLVRGIKTGPVSAATDINFGSVGLDNMFFRDDAPTDTVQDAAKSLWWNMAGAAGGVAEQLSRGVQYALDGDWQRWAENFAPGFIKGSLVAKRLADEGYVTPSTGDVVKAREEYTLGKLLLQAGGFGSTEVVDVQKTNIMVKRTVDAIDKERAQFLRQLDMATLRLDRNPTDENATKISDIWDEIAKWEASTGYIHPISNENAAESAQTRAEARGRSMQGLRVPEQYDALVRDTLRDRE